MGEFYCNVCERACTSYSNLRLHERMHHAKEETASAIVGKSDGGAGDAKLLDVLKDTIIKSEDIDTAQELFGDKYYGSLQADFKEKVLHRRLHKAMQYTTGVKTPPD